MKSFNRLLRFRTLFQKLAEQEVIISEQEKLIKEASAFIKEIEKGRLEVTVSRTLNNNELGISLLSMQKHLSKIASDEEQRSWMNVGLAKFSDILRNKDGMNIQDLANYILMNLVKYVNANQGGIFLLEDVVESDKHLNMIACYAYNRKKYLNKRIELGEGLVGQCFLEQESIYITEVPNGYINITSGLGEATPNAVLISPLKVNDRIFGVLELASFEEFQTHKIEFINRLAENIASSIKNVKDNERTLLLLNASQQQAEELRAQEEEMRQNMEEMQATQEEMARKNIEIARASAEAEGLLKGINATMATIEFTPDGIIVDANANFLKTMKCSLEEIKGKHHRNFVPQEILVTQDYKTFWTRLSSGISVNGVFRRINLNGETVWLNAIYNPIIDETGVVTKVIKFAIDITTEQETLAENKGILKGIDASMAMIEFTPDGNVITANNNFLKLMKYSLEDIKGKHHRKFIPSNILITDDYNTFWAKLASGIPISGVFERVNSENEKVWINAIYNPIFSASGEVIKVVKFATDITSERVQKLGATV